MIYSREVRLTALFRIPLRRYTCTYGDIQYQLQGLACSACYMDQYSHCRQGHFVWLRIRPRRTFEEYDFYSNRMDREISLTWTIRCNSHNTGYHERPRFLDPGQFPHEKREAVIIIALNREQPILEHKGLFQIIEIKYLMINIFLYLNTSITLSILYITHCQ